MTITQEKIDDLHSRVKVNLKKEDYEPQVKKQLKTLGKVVQIKGFRPGMVPPDLIKKMYGNEVLAEELNKILNDEVYKYITDNNIDIVGSPIPVEGQKLDIDINGLRDIDFDFEIGIAPDITLSFLDSFPTFIKYRIKVDDKMIDEEVDRIRKRFATYEYPETVGDNDILTFTIEELDEEGNLKLSGINTVSSVMVDLLRDSYKTQVLALKKQESFEADVFDLMDRDRESIAKNVLNMNDLAKLNDVGNRFRLTLNNITRSTPAVVNEEFVQKVYGDKGPKTEEEMRAHIKADLEAYYEGQTDSYLLNNIYKAIVANVYFPLPDDFLRRWIELTNENPVSKEEIEQSYPSFARRLRWILIQKKVKKQENIEVAEEEVRERLRVDAVQRLSYYGLSVINEEWINEIVQKNIVNKDTFLQTRDQILEDKVLNYLKTKIKLVEKEVTIKEFEDSIEKGIKTIDDIEA